MEMSEMDDAMSAAGDASDEKRGREKLLRSMMLQQLMGGGAGMQSQFGPFLGALQGMMSGGMQPGGMFARRGTVPKLGPDASGMMDPMMGGYT